MSHRYNWTNLTESEYGSNQSEYRLVVSEYILNESDYRLNESEYRLNESKYGLNESEYGLNKSEYRLNGSEYGFNETEYGLKKDQRIAIVLYFIFGVIAVTGNTILTAAMLKNKLLQYGGFFTLFHNAFPDIAVGCINMFYTPWVILKYGDKPQLTDKGSFIGMLLVYALFSRKMFMVFMAFTKFWSIMFPMSARGVMTPGWYRKALCSVWLISCGFCLTPWIKRCAYFDVKRLMWAVGKDEHFFYFVYWATINALVTAIFLATYPVCFWRLVKHERYWKNRTIGDSCYNTNVNSLNGDEEKTVTSCLPQIWYFREKTLLYIFSLDAIVYMLFTIPVYLFELLHIQIDHYGMYKETLRGILTCYTPIMYSCLNRNIRNAIFDLILSPFVKSKHLKYLKQKPSLTPSPRNST